MSKNRISASLGSFKLNGADVAHQFLVFHGKIKQASKKAKELIDPNNTKLTANQSM